MIFPIGISANHKVGEIHLEQTEIWEECCREFDCVPQTVEMEAMGGGMVAVKIDGYPTTVQVRKFYPVPPDKTWVCYVDTVEGPIDEQNRV